MQRIRAARSLASMRKSQNSVVQQAYRLQSNENKKQSMQEMLYD